MFGAATQNGVGIGIGNIPTLTSLPYSVQLNLAVQQLFANGEPGFWLDPSDLSTMYQDAAGTTPVTAVEQPVGLILDKSKGLVLGAELITLAANRNFTSDTGFWTKDAGVTIGSGACTFASVASNGGIINTLPLVVGGVYSITYTIATITSGGIQGTCNSTRGTAQTTPGTYTEIICAPVGGYVGIVSSTAGTSGTVTSISVKRLLGTHYYQSTAGVRPVLSARVNLLIKTEQLNDAAWTKANSAVTAVTAPDGTNTAFLLYPLTTGTGVRREVYATATGLNCPNTVTVIAKAAGKNWLCIIAPTGSSTTATYFNLATGVVGTVGGGVTASITPYGGGYYTCKVSITGTAAYGEFVVVDGDNSFNVTANGTDGVILWHPDVRPTDQATGLIPTYQRVNTSTDYDTAGFPLYLSGNGTQWMQCAAQDYTGVNKMLVCAGVRKIGAGTALVNELSANSAANAGSFYIGTSVSGSNDGVLSNGTSYQGASASIGTAPYSKVLTGLMDIAAPYVTFRSNGAQVATNTSSQGTGNYGNYAAYLFARAGSSLFLTGNIYQLIARGSTVASNAAQIAATENWTDLKTKAY